MNKISAFFNVMFGSATYKVSLDGGVIRRVHRFHREHADSYAKATPGDDPVTFEESLSSLIENGLEQWESERGEVASVLGTINPKEKS